MITKRNRPNKKIEKGLSGSKAWAYLRVSSKDQFENNGSISNQEASVKEFALKNNIIITRNFNAEYESAATDSKRKEFQIMLKSALSAKTNERPEWILVYSVSRFSRAGIEGANSLHSLIQKGINVFDISTGHNTLTESGRSAIMNSLNYAYTENINRKAVIIPGLKRAALKGIRFGNSPLGYDHYGPRVKNQRFLEAEQRIIINNEGRLLRKAFDMKLENKFTDKEIRMYLESIGLKISKQRISAIWRNSMYAGYFDYDLIEHPVKGNWDPLISESEFESIQVILKGKNQNYRHVKNERNRALASGFLKCKSCNQNVTSYLNKKIKTEYYKCTTCGWTANAETKERSLKTGLNTMFFNILESFQIPTGIENLILNNLKNTLPKYIDSKVNQRSYLKEEIKKLETEIQNIEINWSTGKVPEDIAKRSLTLLIDKKNNLDSKLIEIPELKDSIEKALLKASHLLKSIATIWQQSDFIGRQQLQKLFFPNGLKYDAENREYLTISKNNIFDLINSFKASYEEKKDGTFYQNDKKSLLVAGIGLEPMTFGL